MQITIHPGSAVLGAGVLAVTLFAASLASPQQGEVIEKLATTTRPTAARTPVRIDVSHAHSSSAQNLTTSYVVPLGKTLVLTGRSLRVSGGTVHWVHADPQMPSTASWSYQDSDTPVATEYETPLLFRSGEVAYFTSQMGAVAFFNCRYTGYLVDE